MAKREDHEKLTMMSAAVKLQNGLDRAARAIGQPPAEDINDVLVLAGSLSRVKTRLSGLAGSTRHHGGLFLDNNLQSLRLKTPDVSIVIPVYNKVDYTLTCLESLSRHKTKYSFEVIIVDNGSEDQTWQVIGSIPGIKYVRNSSNLGFVEGCNIGAAVAHGKNLVFLNNDTSVMGNWLDALIDRLADKSVGIAGSKLIYPDGTLQDAGGIIFSDGSGHNYGKGFNAKDFQYNFVRDVDYCTGASLAISKRLFEEVGGFDMRYAPAYYEDTDLAMSVRKRGWRVVYEPYSVVVHIEGGTAGVDTGSGLKRFQPINQKKFIKKWAKELAENHSNANTPAVIASRPGKAKRLLVIDSIVPEPDRDAGSLRMRKIIQAAMNLGYVVTLLPDNLVASQPYTSELQNVGVEVVYGRLSLQDFYKDRFNVYDAVLLSRPLTAVWHLDLCRAYQPKAKLIYDTVDLHFLRTERQAKVENSKKLRSDSVLWRQLELELMNKSDATIVVSTSEKELLLKEKPDLLVEIIPTINERAYDPKTTPGFADRAGLIFIGSSHPPNEDAAAWFCRDILPSIQKKLPSIIFSLLGSNPSAVLKSLESESVLVPGYIEDVSSNFNHSRIFICPMRFGAGVKGKLSQAMGLGLPIVTTTIGAEGMHLINGQNCLIADTPKEFSEKVIKLYDDEELWLKLQKNALKTFDQYFSEKAGQKALENAIENS